jgi:hypothetical protein
VARSWPLSTTWPSSTARFCTNPAHGAVTQRVSPVTVPYAATPKKEFQTISRIVPTTVEKIAPTRNRPCGRFGIGFGGLSPGPAAPPGGHGACVAKFAWNPRGFGTDSVGAEVGAAASATAANSSTASMVDALLAAPVGSPVEAVSRRSLTTSSMFGNSLDTLPSPGCKIANDVSSNVWPTLQSRLR